MQFVLDNQVGRATGIQAEQARDFLAPDDLREFVNRADQ